MSLSLTLVFYKYTAAPFVRHERRERKIDSNAAE